MASLPQQYHAQNSVRITHSHSRQNELNIAQSSQSRKTQI